jgi:hypothetical protein
VRSVQDSLSGEIVGHIALDSDPNNLPVQPIHCLICTAREKYDKWQLTCLGLVPTDESKKEFSWVGLVFIRKEDWFGELHEFDLDEMDLSSLSDAGYI